MPQHGWSSDPTTIYRMAHQKGLTKREEFAKAAMMGFLASSQEIWVDGKRVQRSPELIAMAAREQADALLAELEKKP
jgi:hypothetical protein